MLPANFLAVWISLAGGLTYKLSQTSKLNGHLYTEVVEQPWFRYPHVVHVPIPVAQVNQSMFGRHLLPEDDIYVKHDWTDEEREYLPCMNLTCVCPYYKGKVSGGNCVLPNGKLLQKAVRKEARILSNSERSQIAVAFNKMKKSGIYGRFGFVHKYSGLHEGPGFFTWHREYLKRFELAFRRFLPLGSNLGLPYWDSSLESELPDPRESMFFSSLFMGATNSTGYIVDGPYSNWEIMEGTRRVLRFVPDMSNGELLNNARIDFVLQQERIEQVLAAVMPLETCKIIIPDGRLLSYSHDYVHFFISGDMKETYSSTSEPIFFFHHTMVDHIWEMWRQLHQTRDQRETDYPPPLPDCYPEMHFGNASLKVLCFTDGPNTRLLPNFYSANVSTYSSSSESTIKDLEPYTNEDVLSNHYTDYMYEYDKWPRCSKSKQDCGSKYLFCHLVNTIPLCIAKIQPGGNCEGFEETSICYEGRCERGRCIIAYDNNESLREEQFM